MEWLGTLFGKLLEVGGPIYLVIGVFLVVLLFGIRILWTELSKERDENNKRFEKILSDQTEKHEKMNKEHLERNERIVKEMFDVINKNTSAISRQAETSDELKESMRELRITLVKSNGKS